MVGVIGSSQGVQLLLSNLTERSIPSKCRLLPHGVEIPDCQTSVQLLYDAATRCIALLMHIV